MKTALLVVTTAVAFVGSTTIAFQQPNAFIRPARTRAPVTCLQVMIGDDDGPADGVVELLGDDSTDTTEEAASPNPAAPFLSQGEISPEALNPDLSDPKQTRVIIYIILSLIPVVFLVPLILGSRDLIPLDALPPVEIS
eukprot:CAMPEP_0194027134 /NCGR_PEP_ID=MMETSP0009_2-20130614/1347_1 /TAXON_ID=210454 /ORGANISM="Grammatophora oceanica, Strain CCMP 410" /LENGTH=138 /DNA_ID=CAMNT_0038666093 /DNA_START=102 /DNA_END=518 /DNA_ORIENTATION=+